MRQFLKFDFKSGLGITSGSGSSSKDFDLYVKTVQLFEVNLSSFHQFEC